MKRLVLVAVLSGVALGAFAQNQNATTQQAVQQALTRIARDGATIENLVYVGMTYDEVRRLLGLISFEIHYNGLLNYRGLRDSEHLGHSAHGQYIILWSHVGQGSVVTGYINRADGMIRQNGLGR